MIEFAPGFTASSLEIALINETLIMNSENEVSFHLMIPDSKKNSHQNPETYDFTCIYDFEQGKAWARQCMDAHAILRHVRPNARA